VNEPVPSVQEHRPDVPVRLARVVQQAMAKDPEDRPEMNDLVRELDACLGENGSQPDEGVTRIVRAAGVPRARRRRRSAPVFPILLAVLAAAFLAGGAYLLADGDPELPAPAAEAEAGPVTLTGAAAYDPEGGDGEHDDEVGNATDKDQATYWTTEEYQDFTKEGVGLVLATNRAVALSEITITTDDPDFEAKIRAGTSAVGPFEDVSGDWKDVAGPTTFDVDTGGKTVRYYLLWIRLPREGGRAHVNEVTART
jgi:hypothetical protein